MAVIEQSVLSPEVIMAQAFRKADAFLVMPGTLQEFYQLGEVKADFIENYIHLHMAASILHEQLFGRTFNKLYNFVEANSLGAVFGSRTPIDFGENYHPMPDIFFLPKDNPAKAEVNRVVGVPDVVVEILSASTRKIDLGDKRQFYRQYQVPEVCFIDPIDRRVIMDLLKEGQYETVTLETGTLESRALPGLTWDVEQLCKI